MERRAASNMRKDLTFTKVLEIIMQPDPSSELQYVLSQIRLQPLQGKCRKSTQGMCHYTFVSTCILFLFIFTEFMCLLEINLKDTVCVLTMFA